MNLISHYIGLNSFSRCLLILLTLLMIPFTQGQAQLSQAAVPFLLMSPDARGRSLADGGSVFATGAASVFYNPANLVSVETYACELNYTKPFPDIADDVSAINLYAAKNVSDGLRLAVGMNRLGYTTLEYVDGWGQFYAKYDSYDLAIGLYGAMDLDSTTYIGIGVKYIRGYLSDLRSDNSFALDFGLLLKNRFPGLTRIYGDRTHPEIANALWPRNTRGISIGLSMANLGPGIAYIDPDQKDPLPKIMRLGIGYQAVDMGLLGVRTTFDATKLLIDINDDFKTELDEIVLSYGIETTIAYFISFRAGRYFDVIGDQRMWSIGAGLGLGWLRFDYSHTFDNEDDWSNKDGAYAVSLYCNIPPGILK